MNEKHCYMNIRATEKEKAVLEYLARIEGVNISEMLRILLRQAAKDKGLPPMGLINIEDLKDIDNG